MNKYLNFKNKVSVITGAGSGIGREVAIKLSNLGSIVILVGRSNKVLKVDGDKSISIRWLFLASQATGISKAKNLLISARSNDDNIITLTPPRLPLILLQLFPAKSVIELLFGP